MRRGSSRAGAERELTMLGVRPKTGRLVSLRDHRAEHEDGPLPAPARVVCARCLRHKIGSSPLCRNCTASDAAKLAAEVEASGQLCACGCELRFAPNPSTPRKRFATRECLEFFERRRRNATRRAARTSWWP